MADKWETEKQWVTRAGLVAAIKHSAIMCPFCALRARLKRKKGNQNG